MKILGYDYTVTEVSYDDTARETHCALKTKTHEIQIAADLCAQERETYVLRGVIKALDFHLGWKLEERQIQSLEAALYQVFTECGVDLAPLTNGIKPKKTRR